jgi:hypothetical protein
MENQLLFELVFPSLFRKLTSDVANKGLTPEERLQRVLQRQKEIEEKFAAKNSPAKPTPPKTTENKPIPQSTTIDSEVEFFIIKSNHHLACQTRRGIRQSTREAP